MLAALTGGVAGRFGASLAISLEEALASLPSIERVFSISENTTPEGTAGTPKIVTNVVPEGEAVDEAAGAKGIPSISRSTEITELFSSSSTRSGIQIGDRSLIEVPNTGNAKIFSGATDVEVKQYFSELTGSTDLPSPRTIPGKGDIYVVNTPEGNFTLRNFSSSSGQTGPAWTIDVPKAATGTTYNPEIKFLIGNP